MGVIVRQKVKGKGKPWWVFVTHNGQRTSKKVGDKKAAEEVASKIRAKLKLGEFDFEPEVEKKPIPKFGDYAKSWIKTTIPATCKASTVRDYNDILNKHVLPVFKETPITEVSRGKIKDFLLDKINNGYTNSTASHMKDVISGVLNKAFDDEIITGNPAHRLGKLIKRKEKNGSIDPLTAEELKHLLKTVQNRFSRHYALFLLLARTGMRIGEALALKWDDIDFNGRFIKVQRGISRGRIETPKSGKFRKVDMSLQLTETLYKLKGERFKNQLSNVVVPINKLIKSINEDDLISREPPEWVFVNDNGKMIDKDNWRRRVFYKALEKAKLRRIRIHDLRHTYASLRIAKGDNIADVSNQLGHHSVKLTMDVYYHWVPGKKKAEVDELDDPIFVNPSAPHLHPTGRQKENGLPQVRVTH